MPDITRDNYGVRVSTPLDRGITRPARRQNFEQGWCQDRAEANNSKNDSGSPKLLGRKSRVLTLNRGMSRAGSKFPLNFDFEPGSAEAAMAVAEYGDLLVSQWEETFASDYKHCASRLEELKSHLRDQDVEKDPDKDNAHAERRRLERERQERERRLREMEKEMRSPKKKIAVKLDVCRESPQSEWPCNVSQVPMQQVCYTGGKGNERVQMVDVLNLKNKCMLLQDGTTVESLIEHVHNVEKQRNYLMDNMEPIDHILENRNQLKFISKDQNLLQALEQGERTDERVTVAKQRRRLHSEKKIAHKLMMMRDTGPASVPLIVTPVFALDTQSTKHASLSGQKFSLVGDARSSTLKPGTSGTLAQALDMLQENSVSWWFERLVVCSACSELTRRYRELKGIPDPDRVRRMSKCNQQEAIARAQRANTLWAGVWRVLKVWRVAYLVRRRTKCVLIMKMFITRLGEAARIRVGVCRFIRNIRVLQSCCRHFIADKHRRVAKLITQWTRVEDAYLSQYFKTFAAKIMAEETARREHEASMKGYNPKTAKGHGGKSLNPGEIVGADRVNSLNWKSFRVPANMRKKALSRHYMNQAWQYTRNSASWVKLARQSIKDQADFARFLKSLGAGDEQLTYDELNKAAPVPQLPSRQFYVLEDNEMLVLIMETAYKELVMDKKHFDQFQNHPAAKELKDSDVAKEAKNARRKTNKTNKRGSTLWATISMGGLARKHRRPDEMDETPKNLDEVFKRGDPRFDDGSIDEGQPKNDLGIENIEKNMPVDL